VIPEACAPSKAFLATMHVTAIAFFVFPSPLRSISLLIVSPDCSMITKYTRLMAGLERRSDALAFLFYFIFIDLLCVLSEGVFFLYFFCQNLTFCPSPLKGGGRHKDKGQLAYGTREKSKSRRIQRKERQSEHQDRDIWDV
jgi:hypothetical protein